MPKPRRKRHPAPPSPPSSEPEPRPQGHEAHPPGFEEHEAVANESVEQPPPAEAWSHDEEDRLTSPAT